MRRSLVRRLGPIGALAAALMLGLGACGPGGDDNESETTGATTKVQTDASSLGDVTLTVWDQEVRGGQNDALKKLNTQFQQKYPNITIKRVAKSFTDLQTTLKLAASGKNPPDVVEANQGWSQMGPLVKAELLMPLDRYANAYGWRDRYSKTLLQMNSFSRDGKRFGTGSLFGISQTGEVVGVYYNKQKLDKLGLDVPDTFEDFETALEKAKAGGEIPIQFGNLDKWPGIHMYEEPQLQYSPKATVRGFIFGRNGFDTAGNDKAAQTVQTWAQKGYFTPGYSGLGYDPSWAQFGKGKGVFLITGSWLTADLKKALGDNVGFFLLPPRSGQDLAALGGEGLPWSISSKTKHADAAAAYIDFVTNDDAAQVTTTAGNLPATNADVKVPSGLDTEVYDAFTKAKDSDAIVPYLDWATPTMYDTVTAAVQKLMAKKDTPDSFVSTVQSDYEKFHASAS
jgi:raffinose/stachyose/melibiose transport system substrate-binding protein